MRWKAPNSISCSTPRSATIPCARFWSAPIVRPRVTWRACSRRRRGAASGSRAAIQARAFWPRCCRRRHERDCACALAPAPPYRKGWCPGALRPMETGDGLLARVRAPRGRLSLDQAAALADAAIACGNGAIGLSARANLHLRGLSESTLPDLHARLEDAGLIDADPEIERLRNIVASPLDDLDPEAFSTSDRASPRWRHGSGRTRTCADCRRSSASSSTRRGACRSATSTRTSASRRAPRRNVRGVSCGRRCAGCAMRAGRNGRCRGAAWPCVSRPCRRWRSGAAADARAGRARRRCGDVREGGSPSEAVQAVRNGAPSLRDVLGAARLRRGRSSLAQQQPLAKWRRLASRR